NNFGHIFGGNGDAVSGNTDGGWGIEYEGSEDAAENIHINNFGWIQGGNSGGELAEGGIGVAIDGNNTRLDNWGVISGGTGSPVGAAFATPALPPPDIEHGDSILVSGSGNVINLNGHSWVIGKITVEGPTNSNTVNLNFTGLTPLQIANLNSQLSSQGVGSGSDTSVTFTVRGVTYDIDPAVIHFNMSSYQLQGVTPNQSAIGAALDSAQTNPNPGTPLAFLFNAIDQAPNQARAIEELSPQPYQIYGDIALANANFTTLEIDQRLYNLRDGSEGVDTAGLNGGETSGLTSMLTNGLSKNDDKGKGVITPMTEENRWGFFAAGNGIFSSVDAHGGDLQDANFTSSGILLGLDGKIHEHWIVGTFFNYEHTWADLDSQGSSADINSYSGGIYAGYHNGGYYGNGLFSYTRNDYSSQRNIRIAGFPGFNESAGGSTSGNQFEGDLDGGYDFNLTDRVSVGPIAGLQYVHLDVDGFSESGAPGAGLAVGSQSLDSLRSRLGFHANYHMKVNQRMSFAADLHAQWQHEFLDDSRGISAAFEGDGLAPFAVQTTSPERDAALLGLGANLTVRDRYTFFLDYDVQAGQQDYLEQSVKGGFKYSW
ncbi:MAG TPA: autotransporter domain-containing protein, partial [Chthoniobacteraceae bacterium]|nr:autotransporter domain-containing protein [Chthoniobacteraceae bacterium]